MTPTAEPHFAENGRDMSCGRKHVGPNEMLRHQSKEGQENQWLPDKAEANGKPVQEYGNYMYGQKHE